MTRSRRIDDLLIDLILHAKAGIRLGVHRKIYGLWDDRMTTDPARNVYRLVYSEVYQAGFDGEFDYQE